MNVQVNTTQNRDYSFLKEFNDYSFLKKFIVLVFLPILPIHIISKGFQIRNWQKSGSEYPPSRRKHITILVLVYIFTFYPIAITFIYLALQIQYFLFIVSFIVAFLLHRQNLIPPEPDIGQKPTSEFTLIGFRKLSITYLALLSFSFVFSFGFFWIFSGTAFLFILMPRIYRKLYFIPRGFLFLSYSFFNFLSIIPGVNISGQWFIEEDSEIKRMTSILDIISFVLQNLRAVFILNVGVSALAIRIMLWVQDDPKVDSFETLVQDYVFTSWGILFVFLIVPIIMACYYVWKLVWQDAELKVARTKISSASKIKSDSEIIETTLLIPAHESITAVFTLVFGIPTIVWLVDKLAEGSFKGGNTGLGILILIAFIVTGATILLMSVMYYRSGIHEELVNKLREDIIQMNDANRDETPIKVGYFFFQTEPNQKIE